MTGNSKKQSLSLSDIDGSTASLKKQLMAGVCTALFMSGAVAAQSDASTEEDQRSGDALNLEEIVITGRASTKEMRKMDVSYSITSLDADDIAERAPRNVPALLKAVPGLWVETGGGHGSSDVRARGIPLDGFESLNLYEDGLPVLHDPAHGWLNGDQFVRHDETIRGVEAVRGGPSAIFASNAPAGYVNFISRTGTEEPEGLVKVSLSDYGTRRIDVAYTGPLANDWFIAVGGHYNYDGGIRDTQFTANKGGQFRVKLSKEFDGGRLDIGWRHLDDNTHFQSGIPLAQTPEGKVQSVTGFDANRDSQSGLDFASVNLKGLNGDVTEYRHDRGTTMKIDQLSLNFEYEFDNGVFLTNKSRFTDAFVRRENSFLWANASLGTDYIAENRDALLAAFPDATGVELRYAATGAAFGANQNGNGLVSPMGIPSVTLPHKEFLNDFRLAKEVEFAGGTHNIAGGFYFGYIQANRLTRPGFLLLDVQPNSERLDLVAVNDAGDVVGSMTDGGLLNHGAWYTNFSTDLEVYSFYASDEWQINDRLRVDFGFRHETITAKGSKEQTQTYDLGDPTTLADDAVTLGNGEFDIVDHKAEGFSWSIGANYDISEEMGAFARISKNFSLPSNVDNTSPESQPRNDIEQAELGLKLSTGTLSLFATAFYNNFKDISLGDRSFDDNGNLVELRAFTDAKTLGLEVEGFWAPSEFFDLGVTATIQDAQYSNGRLFDQVTGQLSPLSNSLGVDLEGNQPRRLSNFLLSVRPGINLMDGDLRIMAEFEYFGKRYADDANTQELPAFHAINAGMTYKISDNLTAQINAQNLTNEIGLVQGAPIVGLLRAEQSVGYFTGRPIYGRNFLGSLTYTF